MAEILVVCNNKGGVAKTTTSVCLATYTALERDKRVLMVDLDPQCNLTAALLQVNYGAGPYLPAHPDGGRYDISGLMTRQDMDVYATNVAGVSLIPCKPENIGLDAAGDDAINEFVQFFQLPEIHEMFDLVIIDTPPAKGALTTAALRAATKVLIPVVMERKPVEGLLGMVQKVELEHEYQAIGRESEIIGILPSKFDSRMGQHRRYLDYLNDMEAAPSIAPLMIPSLLDQGDLPSFVIKERSVIKDLDVQGAIPSTPFGLRPSADARREWVALGEFVAGKVGV